MAKYGPHLERLAAVAASTKILAIGGARDFDGAQQSQVHLIPHGKGKAIAVDVDGAATALLFWSSELLLAGTSRGKLIGIDASGESGAKVLELDCGGGSAAAITALAKRGAGDQLAATTADGAVHLISLAMRDARPEATAQARRAICERALATVTFDAAGLLVFGGDDGLWSLPLSDFEKGAPRPLVTGGEGGARAVVSLDDGRVAVGYGDGTIRLCYLVGEVDAQDRSGEHAHAAPIRALLLGPQLKASAGPAENRRLFSLGEDGVVKSWEYDSKRRPRSAELSSGTPSAMALQPGAVRGVEGSVGQLHVVTRARKIVSLVLAAEAELAPSGEVTESELERLAADLADQKPKAQQTRAAAVKALEGLAEDEARQMLDGVLGGDSVPDLRVAAAGAIERTRRLRSRPALRLALAAQWKPVRAAAFRALAALEREQPLSVVRAGMEASSEDVRALAVERIRELANEQAALVPSLLPIATEALRDASADVRARALRAVTVLSAGDADPLAALRIALARGPGDVRLAALQEVAIKQRDTSPAALQLVLQHLDDDDAAVRLGAFMSALVQRPSLHATVGATPAAVGYFLGFEERLGKVTVPEGAPAPTEAELEPLFASLACRKADAALRGAEALVQLGDARAVGAILQLSREQDAGLRRIAVTALSAAQQQFGDDDRLEARLGWLLDDADAQVRNTAFAQLEAVAKAQSIAAQIALAETALRASQEDIRVRALQILVAHGRQAEDPAAAQQAARLLADALDDEAEKVRAEAFRTLWAWNSSTPEIPLERGAKSRHADLRKQVIAEIERRREAKKSNAKLDAMLLALVSDAVADVGLTAHKALLKVDADKARLDVHLAALRSPAPAVRAAGAKAVATAPSAVKDAAARQSPDPLLAQLVALIKQDIPAVHLAAIEALDAVAPTHAEGFALAFASIFYELQVRAAELCGARRDARALAPAQRLLSIPKTDLNRPADVLRQRATRALADVGDPQVIPFAVGLLGDDDAMVRETAARALATACGPGREQPLVDALAHADLPVRSWAAEGLAKIGDLRALPVLAGTQRHTHRPLRIGAIVGFVALGPDGVRGLRQGLEDPDREVCDIAFAIIVARDAALAKAGQPPDLLFDALSAPSPELRFAGARILEARAAGAVIEADELIGPRKPDRSEKGDKNEQQLKEWPAEPRRRALLAMLADSIASDDPVRRYAAAQVLALRSQPLSFWREAGRLAGPAAQLIPHTNWSVEARSPRKSGWLRRLTKAAAAAETAKASEAESELERLFSIMRAVGGPLPGPVPPRPQAVDAVALRRLVFGVYAGLVRQAPARGESDETHRVRRDAMARLVELAADAAIGRHAVLPVLAHGLADPHHLVRGAAMTGLRSLYPAGALEPLAAAMASAADVGSAAIDELLALALGGNAEARSLLHRAVDVDDSKVRRRAAEKLARLYPARSVEPHLVAARSKHADVRQEAVTELLELESDRPEVMDALVLALGSDDVDLRMQAATALADRGDARGVDVLSALMRDEDQYDEAVDALETLGRKPAGAPAAAAALAARLEADTDRSIDRERIFDALATIGHEAAVPTLLAIIHEPVAEGKASQQQESRDQASDALLRIARQKGSKPRTLRDGRRRHRLRDALALGWFADAMRSGDPSVRKKIAEALGDVDDRGAEPLLEKLLSDRENDVRVAACEALALRAWCEPTATLAPLEHALRAGRRELILPAAEGMARRGRPEAFQPLVLVLKAGEPDERERALLALGSLGDWRALEYILPLIDPANEDQTERALAPAAMEAIGRMLPALEKAAAAGQLTEVVPGVDVATVRQKLERTAQTGSGALRSRALVGLRMAGDERSRVVLENLVTSEDAPSHLRRQAIEQVGQLANPASEPALVTALGDDDYSVWQGAYGALRRVFAQDPMRVALLALGSPHNSLSERAARYLSIKGDSSILKRLVEVENEGVRRWLREGLVRRAAWTVSDVVAALGDASPNLRVEAAWIAGAMAAGAASGDKAQLATAVQAAIGKGAAGWRSARESVRAKRAAADLPEREAQAWQAALWAARRLGLELESAALAAVSDAAAPAAVRQEAMAGLVERGSAAASAALERAVGDVDPRVRGLAARKVAEAGAARAEAVVKALGDRIDPVSAGPVVAAAFPKLGSELLADDATRSSAVAVSLIHHTVEPLVASALAKGDGPARLAAIAALGRLGGETAKATLEKILANKTEKSEVRAEAFKALKRLLRAAEDKYAGLDRERGKAAIAAAASTSSSDDDDDSDDDDSDDSDDDDDDSDDDDSDDDDDDSDDDDDDSDDDDDDEEEEDDDD